MDAIDWEIFAVEIISWSRSTAKINHVKNNITGDDQCSE